MEKVFLNQNRSKLSASRKNSLGVLLKNSERLLPTNDFHSTINLVDLYNEERQSSTLIRLNCVIKPYCTNILYNTFTEIVQNEGSDDAICLNFESSLDNVAINEDYLFYKDRDDYASGDKKVCVENGKTLIYNLIEDTQLSSKFSADLEYHCGLDFFNNHLIRSTTFKNVNPLASKTETSEYFNTIMDYHRHYDGTIISADTMIVGNRDFSKNVVPYKAHLYEYDDLMKYTTCVNESIKEQNGWFGFINKGKIKIYDINNNDTLLDISKPINNRDACEFIDLYPTRDLFSFAPKYNTYRHRIEKNWNYCITYPYSSTTQVPFIDDRVKGGALRIFLIDESYANQMKIYSMTKHGLKEGDYIRLYRNGEMEISNMQVKEIVDEFTFFVIKNGYSIGSSTEMAYNNSQIQIVYDETTSSSTVVASGGTTTYKYSKDNTYYYDLNSDFMTFSFKKLYEGNELDYYVRILSKMPNWKFSDKKISEKVIYEDYPDMIDKYQNMSSKSKEQFENHISKLAFSKTIYCDDVSEIIFTDDIDIDYLHDNLQRPLTDIFLTIVKNNKGNVKWYEDKIVNEEDIEYSHCFGRVSCGFVLSPHMYDENVLSGSPFSLANATVICESADTSNSDLESTFVSPFSGLNTTLINDEEHLRVDYATATNGDKVQLKSSVAYEDTVDFEYNNHFYGDLCSYCHETCDEVSIQDISYRFNTYRREHQDNERLSYAEIYKDDYDTNSYSTDDEFIKCGSAYIDNLYEGYYYKPHYKIDVRTVSSELESQSPKIFTIRRITQQDDGSFKIYTNENNYIEKDDHLVIYVKGSETDWFSENVGLNCKATEIIELREFVLEFTNDYALFDETESERIAYDNFKNKNKVFFKVCKPDKTIPNHAELLMNGSCQYVWRDIIQNGFDTNSNIERYPFTNGRLYIMKDFDFFLKRQNPNNDNILTNSYYYDFIKKGISISNENNYYEEKDISC